MNHPSHAVRSAEAANPFDERVAACGAGALRRRELAILQVNVGRLCNQACRHCHVEAGPNRTELMAAETAEECLAFLDSAPTVHTLDITGGAPEMAPVFRRLVREGRRRGLRVIDRCNLTILAEPGHEDLAAFLADQGVDIVASLPCYSEGNVDKQRGGGVFGRSIEGLRILNRMGYGAAEGRNPAPGRRLDLVFNPGGPSLPPAQAALEADYRERLRADFGIVFDSLITITNMPIGRFASDLRRAGRLDGYMDLLAGSFNPATLAGLMCRDTLSVDHEGFLYDCDFNQMLGLPLGGRRRRIREVRTGMLDGAGIATGAHCLGCAAGAGSSCGGALA